MISIGISDYGKPSVCQWDRYGRFLSFLTSSFLANLNFLSCPKILHTWKQDLEDVVYEHDHTCCCCVESSIHFMNISFRRRKVSACYFIGILEVMEQTLRPLKINATVQNVYSLTLRCDKEFNCHFKLGVRELFHLYHTSRPSSSFRMPTVFIAIKGHTQRRALFFTVGISF